MDNGENLTSRGFRNIFNAYYEASALSGDEKLFLTTRNTDSDNSITESVLSILADVKERGDLALREYTAKFDKAVPNRLWLDEEQIKEIAQGIKDDEKQAIDTAYANIRKFHESQLVSESVTTTMPGVSCWRERRAIERVGLYVPGGSAVLPSTFLMLGIPARIAGCREIVVCSPPQADASINPYVAYVAILLNVPRIYLCGGAQAVAAMAYGTESVPAVDKIFGPGNQFVTRAKTIVQSTTLVSIDMPAGPSEVLIYADETANAAFVAADLLAQAEHGRDSQAVLVTTHKPLIQEVQNELSKQLKTLSREAIAAGALENSYIVYAENLKAAMTFSNAYAPEHLIVASESWSSVSPEIVNAGSVFLGNLTPESAGDYASGTNHTLPTSAYARSYSGVSVDSFVKKITFQHITQEGVKNISASVEKLAGIEGLDAHRHAMKLRREFTGA